MERKESGTRELTLHLNCPHCNEGEIRYKNAAIALPMNMPLRQGAYRDVNGLDIVSVCDACNGNYELELLELEGN